MTRNKDHLESRRDERKQKLRKDWTTHENFVTMYDRVYAAMVGVKLATPLDKPEYYFINKERSRFKT